ncbi:MAG TPA: ferritin family protein [Sedimentisphaerales bacterium]|nr:ferritin family protein [Sedimentisphaerales bacterium]
MSISFNAIEVFEIAERIERNSVKFYRRAAEALSDQDLSGILLNLAEFEKEHEETFADMRKQISNKEWDLITFDPEDEMTLYLRTTADSHIFDLKKDPGEQLKDKETAEDIFEYAIEAEKNSIIFYIGLKNFVPAKAGKDKVDEIIKEEMDHIAELNQRLEAWKYLQRVSI